MSLDVKIVDGFGTSQQAQVFKRNGNQGLVVYTEKLILGDILFQPALNDVFGVEMAIDGSFSGNPVFVNDGTDTLFADSGTTDGTTSNKLVDSSQNFVTTVTVGMPVHNTTDDTYATVTAVDSNTVLSLSADIMTTGENYQIDFEWTGTAIAGVKFVFDSTDQANTGTKSFKINNASINDTAQFAKGADQDLTNFVGISFFVFVDTGWTTGDSISFYGYDTGTGMQVGDKILIEDFINEFQFDEWQKISLNLLDLDLVGKTIDAFRIEIEGKNGVGPIVYFDDIQIEETSGATEFKVEAPKGKKYFINEFRFSYVDAIASTLADNSMTSLSYNKILGINALTTGITFQRIQDGKILFSASIKTLGDSLKGGADLINQISDGTNTCITIKTNFMEPVLLDSRKKDSISVIINDDLTGLISFTAIATGRTEEIT